MYRSQKVHLFPSSLSFLAEAQPRLENSNYKAKDIGKLQIYFVPTFFK
jgi:hypothetical protein